VPREGPAHSAPVALATGGVLAPGVFVLEHEAGLLDRRADGTLVLEPVGAAPRELRARITTDACGPDARGELVLPALGPVRMPDASSREAHLAARYGLAPGDTLCLRALEGRVEQLGEPGWLSAAPDAEGVRGVARTREGMTPVRCRPAPPLAPATPLTPAPAASH
jgi:hypothetical protein